MLTRKIDVDPRSMAVCNDPTVASAAESAFVGTIPMVAAFQEDSRSRRISSTFFSLSPEELARAIRLCRLPNAGYCSKSESTHKVLSRKAHSKNVRRWQGENLAMVKGEERGGALNETA